MYLEMGSACLYSGLWEAEAGQVPWVWGQPRLHREHQATLSRTKTKCYLFSLFFFIICTVECSLCQPCLASALQLCCIQPKVLSDLFLGAGKVSAVQSTWLPFRRPGFGFQHHMVIITPVPGAPTPLDLLRLPHTWYTYTRLYVYTYKYF